MASKSPDVEALLVESLEQLRGDPRLFLGAATWLKVYGALVDGHQLVRLLEERKSATSSALLGALLTASTSPHLKGLLARCQPLLAEEILFDVMADNPILSSKVEAGALPEIRRWGLLVDDLTLKPDALRPSSWVLRMNPELQIRALLGANLRAAILNRLLQNPTPPSISHLARDLGRSYASVHAAVGALLAAGLVHQEAKGRAQLLRVPEDVSRWLFAYPAALTPKLRREAAA
jgi:DNA-binding transcriptional ArsR family regulator